MDDSSTSNRFASGFLRLNAFRSAFRQRFTAIYFFVLGTVGTAMLTWCIANADVPGATRISAKLTPSGIIDSRYLDGNDGTTGIPLVWATTINNISIQSGSSYSVSLCQLYLTQAGSPNATVTVASGYSLPTGWSIGSSTSATCTLDYSGTGTTTTTPIKITATRSGVVATTPNEFTITVVAPPSSDTTPPPIPTGLTATSGVSGQIPIAWDRAWDSNGGEGTDYYQLRDGSTVLATIDVDALTAKQPALTTTNIGAGSGTHTVTRSGNQLTLTCAGTGMDDTADGECFSGAEVAGQVCATAKVTSITDAATYNKAGLEIRASTDVGAIAYSWYGMNQDGAFKVQLRRRSSTGGSRGSLATVSLTAFPVWLQLCKSSTGVITGTYSTDGNAFTSAANEQSTLPDTALVGFSATATSAGVVVAGVLDEANITQGSQLSYTYNTTSAASLTVRACDAAANCSSYGGAVSATPAAPADTTAPARTVQPSGNATGSSTSIVWSLGTCTDAGGLRGYVPYTKTSAGGTRTTQAEQSSNTWTQTGLTANTTYYLDVKCVDLAGNFESAYSNEVSATTAASVNNPTTAPTISSVTSTGTSAPTATLRVTWGAVTNAHHYRVRYKLASASSYTLLSTQFTSVTTDITGLAVGSTYDVQVAAANASESVITAYSTAVQGTTQSLSANAIKWHPGYYMKILRGTAEQSQSYRFSLYNSIASNANVKGVTWSPRWGNLETSQGVYDFSSIQAELNKLKNLAVPKYLILRMETSGGYGNTSAQSVSKKVFPQYILDQGCLFEGMSGSATKPNFKFWRSDCMNRFIAFYQALGAALDSDPYLEGVTLMYETAQQLNVSTTVSEFSASAYDTQLRRLYVAAKAAFPHTTVVNNVNYMTGLSEAASIPHYDYMYSVGVGYANADGCADCSIYGDRIVRGVPSGSTDRRGAMPIFVGAETSEMGCNYVGPTGGYTATQLAAWDNATMHSDHIEWDYNEVCGTADQKWSTGLLPYINAHPSPTYTACPTSYAQGCNTN